MKPVWPEVVGIVTAVLAIGLSTGIVIGHHTKACPPAETFNYTLPDGTSATARCLPEQPCRWYFTDTRPPAASIELDPFNLDEGPFVQTHIGADECEALAGRHKAGELWVSDDGGVCVLYRGGGVQ